MCELQKSIQLLFHFSRELYKRELARPNFNRSIPSFVDGAPSVPSCLCSCPIVCVSAPVPLCVSLYLSGTQVLDVYLTATSAPDTTPAALQDACDLLEQVISFLSR